MDVTTDHATETTETVKSSLKNMFDQLQVDCMDSFKQTNETFERIMN